MLNLRVAVVARPAVPGRVKTRLIGSLTAAQAADIHRAMLDCVLDRVTRHLPGDPMLAMDRSNAASAPAAPAAVEPITVPPHWRVIDQGVGDLGRRMAHIWRSVGGGAIVFLGADSPDVPADALAAIPRALRDADAAVGPVSDGGYWTLAARRHLPALLEGIDWGGPAVYHQTVAAARRMGSVTLATLPAWHDVDDPADLAALRRRLETASHPEPALGRLRDRLRRICETSS